MTRLLRLLHRWWFKPMTDDEWDYQRALAGLPPREREAAQNARSESAVDAAGATEGRVVSVAEVSGRCDTYVPSERADDAAAALRAVLRDWADEWQAAVAYRPTISVEVLERS